MRFIFPQNFAFKNKILGFIDISTLFLNIIWDAFVFCFFNLIFSNTSFIFSCFIVLCFPLFLFSIIGFNHENIVYVLFYLLKFICAQKLYFYNKSSN